MTAEEIRAQTQAAIDRGNAAAVAAANRSTPSSAAWSQTGSWGGSTGVIPTYLREVGQTARTAIETVGDVTKTVATETGESVRSGAETTEKLGTVAAVTAGVAAVVTPVAATVAIVAVAYTVGALFGVAPSPAAVMKWARR